MNKEIYTVIIASGSCIPELVVKNEDFMNHKFFDPKDRNVFDKSNKEIIDKFYEMVDRGKIKMIFGSGTADKATIYEVIR